MTDARSGVIGAAWSFHREPVNVVPPEQRRVLRRLALAAVLVVTVGLTQGLDAAMVVAFSLAVMEIDAHYP